MLSTRASSIVSKWTDDDDDDDNKEHTLSNLHVNLNFFKPSTLALYHRASNSNISQDL
jgi:hypothetical protein